MASKRDDGDEYRFEMSGGYYSFKWSRTDPLVVKTDALLPRLIDGDKDNVVRNGLFYVFYLQGALCLHNIARCWKVMYGQILPRSDFEDILHEAWCFGLELWPGQPAEWSFVRRVCHIIDMQLFIYDVRRGDLDSENQIAAHTFKYDGDILDVTRRVIERLDGREAKVFEQRYVEGLSVGKISRLHKAEATLRTIKYDFARINVAVAEALRDNGYEWRRPEKKAR